LHLLKKGKWKKRKKLLEKYFSISKQLNCQSQLATPTKGKKLNKKLFSETKQPYREGWQHARSCQKKREAQATTTRK